MIDDRAADALFRNARTANGFLDKPVSDDQLRALYDLMKMAPTAANGQPARLVFLRSQAAKERLRPALSAGNLDKTLAAPVCAIVAYDTQFHEHLPTVFPHNQTAKSWFEGDANKAAREISAFRNGSMQGGYFILAARAVGLDCGPMSGFNNAKVDEAFFPDGRLRSNFLCTLGTIDPSKTFGRLPRLSFEEACQVL
ncbi:MAG TPA: malonic semialdehyde reductase [Burkholderiaceae bacterium]|jgi:3-hydroxypropanoate dehydrogenase|nr:malonic semialdehyde reductase [Burkholderiaceae bacterium]